MRGSADAERARDRRLVGDRSRDRADAPRGGLRAHARRADGRAPRGGRRRARGDGDRRRRPDEEECARLVAAHLEAHGGLDVLVNSAGVGIAGQIGDTSTKQFDLQQAVNLRGAFLVTREALPPCATRGATSINLASIAGTIPTPGLATYGAAKAALIALTGHSVREEADTGVRATALCPGFVDTPMAAWTGIEPDGDDPAGGLRGDRPRAPPPQPGRPRSRSSWSSAPATTSCSVGFRRQSSPGASCAERLVAARSGRAVRRARASSRESSRSRRRIVSWPIRSSGPNAASSTRSIESRSGW